MSGTGSWGFLGGRKTELLGRACAAAVLLQPLVNPVLSIQHCSQSSSAAQIALHCQTYWEGGEDWEEPSQRLSKEHYELPK